MTPAPTTPSVAGTPAIAKAPSLSRTSRLSISTPGSERGFEPVAMITCFAVSSALSGPSTLIDQPCAALPPVNEPRPWKNLTLFFLKR
jgi:hypothetical protein